MAEIWKEIIGYNGQYLVSNLGRVKSAGNNSTRKEKILKCSESGYKRKYSIVCLRKNLTNTRFYVHRLVAMHFIPNSDDLNYVNHIDNNSLNNKQENLEWCTMKDNIKHAWKNGHCKPHGVGRKLSDRSVIEIKILLKFGISCRDISDYFKMSESAISGIKSGRTFKDI